MIYVYAVTEPSTAALPDVRGLEDRPVELTDAHDTVPAVPAGVFSRHDVGRFQPTAENVWRHESVIEAVMRDRTLLPARFGTVFADEQALGDTLSRNRDALTGALVRVRGCVELGVRLIWRQNDHVTPGAATDPHSAALAEQSAGGPGRAYMLARLADERHRRAREQLAHTCAGEVHRELAALSREATLRVLAARGAASSGAYLVERDRVEEFRARVARVATGADASLRLLCTGPWPPYHFVPALAPAGAAAAVAGEAENA